MPPVYSRKTCHYDMLLETICQKMPIQPKKHVVMPVAEVLAGIMREWRARANLLVDSSHDLPVQTRPGGYYPICIVFIHMSWPFRE